LFGGENRLLFGPVTLRAADFGVTALAARNVMIRIFFFGATFGDPLSQASQTSVPRLLMSSSAKKTTNKCKCECEYQNYEPSFHVNHIDNDEKQT
jgi:hypothetical protein